MLSKFDKEFGSLSWTKRELARGGMSRREFIQLAMVAGLSAGAAEILFTKAQAATPKKGGRLRVAISWGSTTNSLDPATYLDNYMFTIGLTIGSLLAQVDPQGNIDTDLAKSFEPSNRAKVWAVKLRKGVTFHNGKDLKPEDVIASVRHHMGEDSKSAVKSVVSQIDDMKADGDNVLFDLKGGNADFPYIFSEQRLTDHAGQERWQSRLEIRKSEQDLMCWRSSNPAKSCAPSAIPTIFATPGLTKSRLCRLIDPTARTNALISGDIDFMDRCEAEEFSNIWRRQPGVEIDKMTGYEHNVFSMNVTAPPFDNHGCAQCRSSLQSTAKQS